MKNNVKKVDFKEGYYKKEEVFCLNSRVEVKNLSIGAKLYGGATKIGEKCFSNYGESTIFDIKKQNILGIIVPSTINVNESIDNTKFVKEVTDTLEYFGRNCQIMESEGSWLSENDGIVIEKSKIVFWNMQDISDFDILLQKSLGYYIKQEMTQEGVSLLVNDGLIIV